MTRRILIDMIKLRAVMSARPDRALPEAFLNSTLFRDGLKTVRELAVFRFTCRRCEDAPCIAVCPADALDKDEEGIITRYTNLCVSCKSCVTICPFGTMMTDFFKHHRNKELYYNLADNDELERFVKACPEGVASIVESDESPADNIYRLNEKVLVKEFIYTTDKP